MFVSVLIRKSPPRLFSVNKYWFVSVLFWKKPCPLPWGKGKANWLRGTEGPNFCCWGGRNSWFGLNCLLRRSGWKRSQNGYWRKFSIAQCEFLKNNQLIYIVKKTPEISVNLDLISLFIKKCKRSVHRSWWIFTPDANLMSKTC